MKTAAKFYGLATVSLPLLLAQGKWVRQRTLRLPPPEGARRGLAGSGKPLHLLVLGDSAAEGVGVTHQDDALLGQLVSCFSTDVLRGDAVVSAGHDVNYQLIANTGDTLADILAHLKDTMAQGNCLTDVDVVVVSAGVNDVTAFTPIRAWKAQLVELIALLQHQLRAKHIVFTAVPPMHYFPALPTPLNRWLGLRAQSLNNVLDAVCANSKHKSLTNHKAVSRKLTTQPTLSMLRLPLSFEPSYMAKDGFHPSAKTYTAWAHAVRDVVINQVN